MEKPIVEIEWLDACSYDDIYELDHEFTCSMVKSVGRLLSQTEDQTVLFRDLYEKDGARDELELSGVLCIPTKWVKNMRVLSET
jgi:hypothetical protein